MLALFREDRMVLSYSMLQTALNIDPDLLKRVIAILIKKPNHCNGGLLLKAPKGGLILPTDKFKFNRKFESKSRTLTLARSDVTNTANAANRAFELRKQYLEAAIVRILKANTTMGHADLVDEVKSQINLFEVRTNVDLTRSLISRTRAFLTSVAFFGKRRRRAHRSSPARIRFLLPPYTVLFASQVQTRNVKLAIAGLIERKYVERHPTLEKTYKCVVYRHSAVSSLLPPPLSRSLARSLSLSRSLALSFARARRRACTPILPAIVSTCTLTTLNALFSTRSYKG